MPVQLRNDAHAGALGEHLFGAGRGVSDMVYLQLSARIGVGLIIDGRPFAGATGIAGEIGHSPVVENGMICRCGNRGCLETVASTVAIADLLTRSRGEPVSPQRLVELVRAGDRGASRAVADAGGAVGRALAATVNVLNPTLVLIGGDLAATGDVLLNPIRSAIERHSVVAAINAVQVTRAALAENTEVVGAAAIQLAAPRGSSPPASNTRSADVAPLGAG